MQGTQTLRIIQLSDAHLGADPETQYRGILPHARLLTLMPAIRTWQPHLVVASGDLSHDHSAASYRLLEQALLPLNCAVMLLPGNHDSVTLQRQFCARHEHWHYGPDAGIDGDHWQVLALNSQWGDRPEGLLSEQALDAFHVAPQKPAIVFVHHHPQPIGTPWIDRFPLLNAQRLWLKLEQHPQIKILACGHTHQGFQQQRGQLSIVGAPSCAINTQAGVRYFEEDKKGPAARWYKLHANGQWVSGILYGGGIENAPKTMEHR